MRRKVTQAEVAPLLDELKRDGATDIRRKPADHKGLIEVRWEMSDVEKQRYAGEMRAWRLPMVLSMIVAAIFVLVLVLLSASS